MCLYLCVYFSEKKKSPFSARRDDITLYHFGHNISRYVFIVEPIGYLPGLLPHHKVAVLPYRHVWIEELSSKTR